MGNKFGTSYEVSEPNEYIVKTGMGIKDLVVKKSCMKWPLQIATRIDVSPHNYQFSLHAMSCEKLQFQLPGVFTIGPNVSGNDIENLEKYARFLGSSDESSRDETIKGIIEGEVRVHSAQMSLEEIFKDRVSFKKGIIDGIQVELDQFGLKVFNANIKELEDAHGSEYFSYMRQKTRSLAENEAKINIADANNKGAIGQAQKESETRITTANITSRTIIAENEQKQTVLNSNTQFQLAQIEQETRLKMSRVTQDQEIQKKNLDLERQVEEVRQQKRLEELRASKGTDAQIAYEIVQKDTDAEVYKQQKIAEARLYNQQKEAEGITLLANSQKKALEEYAKVFKDDHSLLTYAMMERGLFTEMAEVNAKAINGLNPQITVWNTGAAGEGSDPFGSFRSIFQAIPPVLSTVQAQTGIQPPSWMGTVPQSSGKREK